MHFLLKNMHTIAWYDYATLENDVVTTAVEEPVSPLLVICLAAGILLFLLLFFYFVVGLPLFKKGKLKGDFFEGIYDWFNK